MKIRESVGSTANVTSIAGKDEKKLSDLGGTSFKGHLKQFESRDGDERICQLVSQIQEQGEKLGKKVDVRELKVYKRMISEFLDEALNNSRQFSKDSRLD